MDEFLPSNIAKSVYGYLISEGCHAAAKTFIETSPRLTECREWVQQGKTISNANTQLLGRNLVEVLNLAISAYSLVDHLKGNEHRLLSHSGEGAKKLYDEIRRFVSADIALAGRGAAADNSQEQPASKGSQPLANDVPPTLTLHTPPYSQPVTPGKVRRTSVADDYHSLVQQSVGEGFDSSLSPDKFQRTKTQVPSPSRQRTSSAPGALFSADLEAVNQSAIEAISVLPFDSPLRTQDRDGGLLAVTSTSAPNPSSVKSSNVPTTTTSSNVVTSAIDVPEAPHVTQCYNVPLPVMNCLPSSYAQPIPGGVEGLPDPPIILVKSQNESYHTGEQTASFLGDQPNTASTPCPTSSTQFNPQDTACIVYPPVLSDLFLKKSNAKQSMSFSKKHVLRKLLPKPPLKDPPNILHIKVMPQKIEEEEEEEDDDDEEEMVDEWWMNPLAGKGHESSDNQHDEKPATQKQTAGDTKENERNDHLTKPTGIEDTTNNNQKDVSLPDNHNDETPKAPRPKLKKNISRSTPRRNSHVRALSFNTPLKPTGVRKANTSPKMPKIKFSPRRSKMISVKRSSLFSPTRSKKPMGLVPLLEGKEMREDSGRAEKCKMNFNSPQSKVPIATRSPATKLSSAWKEVNDVVIPKKPVWDKYIRSFMTGDFVDPPPPPKRQTKLKPKENLSQKGDEESSSKCNKNEAVPRRSSRLNGSKGKTAKVPEKKVSKRNKKHNQLVDVKSRAGPSKFQKKKNKVLNKSCEMKTSVDEMNCSTSDIVNSSSDDPNIIKSGDGKNNSEDLVISSSDDANKTKPGDGKNNSNDVVNSSSDAASKIKPGVGKNNSIDVVNSSSDDTVQIKLDDGKNNSNTSVNSDTSDENCQSHMNNTVTEKPVLPEEQILQPTTVLVEDLVVSPNSLPPADASPKKNNGKIVKETQLSKEIGLENISSESTEAVTKPGIPGKYHASDTCAFPIPLLPVLETPIKDIQNSSVTQTPVLNTPLLKTIRQDTSVLHEDLLLTPSLPPTPQVQSGQLSAITPVKPVVTTEETDKSPLINIHNRAESYKIGEGSTNSKQSNNTNNVSNIGSHTNKPQIHKSRQIAQLSDSTSDDSSEEDSDDSLEEVPWVDPKDIPKIRTRIIQEGNAKSKYSKNACKVNINKPTQVIERSGSKPATQKQDNISKLRSTILEDQMKLFDNKFIKAKDKKKGLQKKPVSRKDSYDTSHSEGNSPTSCHKIKKKKCLKKNTKPNPSNVLSNIVNKNKCPTLNVGKNYQSPEKIQLTLDLLKQERKIIFGEGYSTSSDTSDSSDAEVFERKKLRVEQKQSKAAVRKSPVKKTNVVIPEDSSSSEDEIQTIKTRKSVSFETTAQVHVVAEVSSSVSCFEQLIEKNPKTFDEHCSKESPKVNQEELKAVEAKTSTDTGQSSEITLVDTNENETNKNGPPLFDDDNASCNYNPNDSQLTHTENNKIERFEVAKQIKLPDASDTLSISCDSTLLDSQEEMQSKNTCNSRQDSSYEEVENHIVIVSTTQKHSTNALCTSEFDPNHKEVYETDENTVTTLSFSGIYFHLSPNLPRKKIKLTPVKPEVFQQFKGDFESKARSHHEGVWKVAVGVDTEKSNTSVNSSNNSKDNTLNFTSTQPGASPNRLDNAEKDLLKATSKPPRSMFDCSDKRETDLVSKPQLTSTSISSAKSKQDLLSKAHTSHISTPSSSDMSKENTPNTSYKTPNSSISHSDRSGERLLKPNYRYHDNVKYDSRKFGDDKGNHKRDYENTPNARYKTPNSSISHSDRSGEDLMESNRSRRSDKIVKTSGWQYENKRIDHASDKRDNSDTRRQGKERANRLTRYQLDRRKERDLYPRRRESPRRKSNEGYDHRERHYGRWQYKQDGGDYLRSSSSRNHHSYRRYNSSCDHKRQESENHSDRFARPGVRRSFSDKSKVTWKDHDRDDTLMKEKIIDRGHGSKPAETLDPRVSAELVRYSLERSLSSSDEEGSLMDYAVTSNSRKSRSSAQSSTYLHQSELANVSKRKTCDDGQSMEQTQEEKRLRLAKEVDMREARSVLKHKMADMLNALHPIQQCKVATVEDNSNEASS